MNKLEEYVRKLFFGAYFAVPMLMLFSGSYLHMEPDYQVSSLERQYFDRLSRTDRNNEGGGDPLDYSSRYQYYPSISSLRNRVFSDRQFQTTQPPAAPGALTIE